MSAVRNRALLWAGGGFAVSLAGYLVVRWLAAPTSIDLAVYRVEGAAIRDGVNLYGNTLATPLGLRATYPPFAAILFVPISYLAWTAAQILGVVVNLALLLVVSDQAARLAKISAPNRLVACLLLASVALWAEPVWTTLRYGQVNLALLALIQWDFLRRDGVRSRGIGIGIAAGIKVTPALFIVYLLLTRRFRMALTAAAAFAASIAVSAAIVPSSTWRFWTKLLWQSDRVGRIGDPANQSIRGMLARLQDTTTIASGWELLIAAVLVVGLGCAVYAYRQLDDGWGAAACAVTGMLVAPIAWTHHWVWCVPILALLWAAHRAWVPLVAIFWTYAVWAVPHSPGAEAHFSWEQTALSGWYVLFGLAFLLFAAVTAWRVNSVRRAPADAAEAPTGRPAPPSAVARGRAARPDRARR